MSTVYIEKLKDVARTTLELNAATTARDQAILAARRAGVSVRAIADMADVSPQTILNIVNRYKP